MTADINVVDYGAVGDNLTDCTAAFRQAASLAAFRNVTLDGSFVDAQTSPRIVIPSGRYIISGEIGFQPICCIEGSKAIIRQTNPVCSSFVFPNGSDLEITGCKFVGGGISISNNNINGSLFSIRQCTFDKTIGAAITVGSINQNGIVSGQLTVERCRFRNCGSSLHSECDATIIENCWTQWSSIQAGENCFQNTRGTMSMRRCMNVPADFTAFPIARRWVSNSGSFLASGTIFSGENGGIPVIQHNTFPSASYPYMGDIVSFVHCQLSAGPNQSPTSAIMDLQGMPAVIEIDNCKFLVEVDLIRASQAALQAASDLVTTGRIHPQIRINGNQTWPSTLRIPAELYPLVCP